MGDRREFGLSAVFVFYNDKNKPNKYSIFD